MRAPISIDLSSIEMDVSIQCRATIDTGIVNEYAERMAEGDKFPPVILYGTRERAWIGDGWHRIMSWQQIGAVAVLAIINPGGRADALKHALSANALHGHRRTNADKRRCVEVALKEFPDMSSRAIAEMCGVSHELVDRMRPRNQLAESASSKRMGLDGKERSATQERKEPKEKEEEQDEKKGSRKLGPPRDGMQFAQLAVMQLEQIREDDAERQEALDYVKGWIEKNES